MTDAACPQASSVKHCYKCSSQHEFWLCFASCPPSLHVTQPEGEAPSLTHPPPLLASIDMADSRQPEDGAPQWDPSGGPEPTGAHGANGYSSSAYRTCQPGAAHMATAPYSARENGFNGELTGAHAVTAGKTCFWSFSFCFWLTWKGGQWVHSIVNI